NMQAVQRMHDWLQSDRKRSGSVTFYDAWPGPPIIDCDGNLYLGFYLRGFPSQFTPWLRVNRDSEFGGMLLKQFIFDDDQITCHLKTIDQLADWLEKNGCKPGKKPEKQHVHPNSLVVTET